MTPGEFRNLWQSHEDSRASDEASSGSRRRSLLRLIQNIYYTFTFHCFLNNYYSMYLIKMVISLKLPFWARVLIPLILVSNSLTALFNSGRIRCLDPLKSWRMLAVLGDWDVITGYNCSLNLETHSIVCKYKHSRSIWNCRNIDFDLKEISEWDGQLLTLVLSSILRWCSIRFFLKISIVVLHFSHDSVIVNCLLANLSKRVWTHMQALGTSR